MVQFEKLPLTRRYLFKALKFALKNPGMALGCLFFGIGPYMTLREFKLAKNFVPKNAVEERMIAYSDTWQHIPTLYLLCMLRQPKTVLELGCRTGNTALPMLEAAKQYDGHVYSVDIETWPELKNFRVEIGELEKLWTFTESDDLKLDWNKEIDLLYIDTSHLYEHTLEELKKYEPLVNSGGAIIFHDIIEEDVNKAITEYFQGRNDITYVRYFNNNGLGVILKK